MKGPGLGSLGVIVVVAAGLGAAPAAAAACTTSWLGGSGSFSTASKWSGGVAPGINDDACIEANGSYTVTVDSGVQISSLTIGTTSTSGTQSLVVTSALITRNGLTAGRRGAITFDATGGGASIDMRSSTLTNSGTITTTGGNGVTLTGNLTNTGTLQINGNTTFTQSTGSALLDNKGTIGFAAGKTLSSSETITNDTGGQINAPDGGGIISNRVFNEGDGTTTGPTPVILGGTINYTGRGASQMLVVNTTINATGTTHPGQSITLDTSNLQFPTGFTNGGSITLMCSLSPHCYFRSSPGLSALSSTLVNLGTITVDPSASQDSPAAFSGNVTNRGTMQVNGNARFTHSAIASTLLNQGIINLADGIGFSSSGDSCGDTTVVVVNDTGGQINASGTGTLNPTNYEQGAGTTSGAEPVTQNCGTLKYTGTGASSVLVLGGSYMTGNLAVGQSLRVANQGFYGGSLNAGDLTNAGSITLDTISGPVAMNLGSTFTNVGTFTTTGLTVPTMHAGTFSNAGVMHVNNGLTLTGDLATQGALEIAADQALTISGAFTQTGGSTNLGGGAAVLNAAGGAVVNSGMLGGAGTVQSDLTNGGVVAPGLLSTPGKLSVSGKYTQRPSGGLTARVTSSANDVLSVSGAAALDGSFAISTDSGFAPTVGQAFTVVTDGSQSGQFATVTGAASGPYDVVYDARDVKLVTTAPSSTPTLSVDNPTITNPGGDGAITFTVKLSFAPVSPVSVAYATADGTAKAPGDYATAAGTLTFLPGETSKTIPVTVHAAAAGPDRTLSVNLAGPTGAALAQPHGTGTILNDQVALRDVAPASGGTTGQVTITLQGAGFTDNPTFKLVRAGHADITATNVSATGGGQTLSGTVDLRGAAEGPWNVVVSLPAAGVSRIFAGGFTVAAASLAKIDAQLVGRDEALGDYPYTSVLEYTNAGNVDATNTLIQIQGFPAGANVQVIGSGSSHTTVDNLRERSVIVSIDRIPAGSTGSVLVRFVPVGPSHSAYVLDTSVLVDSAPAASQDPSLHVTNAITSQTASSTRGVLHVTGAFGAGDISYSVSSTSNRVTSVQGQLHGGVARLDITAPEYTPATAPPPPDEPVAPPRGPIRFFKGPLARGAVALSDFVDTEWFFQAGKLADRTLLYLGGAEDRFFRNYILNGPQKVWNGVADHYAADNSRRDFVINCLARQHLIPNDKVNLNLLHDLDAAGSMMNKFATLVSLSGGLDQVTGQAANALKSIANSAWSQRLVGFPGGSFTGIAGTGSHARLPPPFTEDTWRQLTPKERLFYLLQACDPKHIQKLNVHLVRPGDPNAKIGPQGYGAQHYVAGTTNPFPYTVQFENVPTASAPAHEVKITDQLDPSKLDLRSLRLGSVYFGDSVASPPPNAQSWTGFVDLRPAKNLIVYINANLDRASGLLTWDMQGLDPATGLLSTDPQLGFLPADIKPPAGQGGVSFTVQPKPGLRTRSAVANAATIVFDRNAPITTATWTNTIDATPPHSRITRITRTTVRTRRGRNHALLIRWSGGDLGSGIVNYTIFAAKGRHRFSAVLSRARLKHATFTCQVGSSYRFYVVAQDAVGNVQSSARRSRRVRCR